MSIVFTVNNKYLYNKKCQSDSEIESKLLSSNSIINNMTFPGPAQNLTSLTYWIIHIINFKKMLSDSLDDCAMVLNLIRNYGIYYLHLLDAL